MKNEEKTPGTRRRVGAGGNVKSMDLFKHNITGDDESWKCYITGRYMHKPCVCCWRKYHAKRMRAKL